MRAGDAVREAVRAARVRVHVAADRRGLLARGSGAYVKPSGASAVDRSRFGQARLDPREAVLGADLEDSGHLRRDHDERVADRGGGPCEPGARAARHDREPVRSPRSARTPGLLGRARERDERAAALHHRGVARVQAPREGIGQDPVRAQHLFEREAGLVDRGRRSWAQGSAVAQAPGGAVAQATRPGEPSGALNGSPSAAHASMPPSML